MALQKAPSELSQNTPFYPLFSAIPESILWHNHDELLVNIYYEHRTALKNIIGCSNNLKKSVENFLAFFEKTEEKKIEEYIRKTVLEHREKKE